MKRELGIARCGLACCLCSENVTCKDCKRDGFDDLEELISYIKTSKK
nr:hypothetical protein [Butyrivibrio sp. VCB2001]